ncbi:uncharacterized protein BJ212DRAFT_1410236 [Suillus subaureus]|uniref:Secreted protein n=1 Tax=Suillus subaureus TaxID=48587 RepID=A0A9P7AVF5_9AGAM|nr:uncharacterized protein BJ212DRAFT_1410236 [Suillus subaureus]KAG1795595.1 hypothetical protein BJ212DRAFT_1410236 [Suillus subaureus]
MLRLPLLIVSLPNSLTDIYLQCTRYPPPSVPPRLGQPSPSPSPDLCSYYRVVNPSISASIFLPDPMNVLPELRIGSGHKSA